MFKAHLKGFPDWSEPGGTKSKIPFIQNGLTQKAQLFFGRTFKPKSGAFRALTIIDMHYLTSWLYSLKITKDTKTLMQYDHKFYDLVRLNKHVHNKLLKTLYDSFPANISSQVFTTDLKTEKQNIQNYGSLH